MAGGDHEEAEAGSEIRKKRKEEVSASPSSEKKKKILPEWRKHAIPCKEGEGGDILKKKKLAFGTMCLWKSRDVPEAMESWIERQAKAEADEEAAIAAGMKKKKKLVRTRVPNGRVEFMMKHLYTTADPFSEEELAKCSASYRQLHSIAKFIDGKMNDYEQILMEQYIKQGYAEDESEITDDDDEDQYIKHGYAARKEVKRAEAAMGRAGGEVRHWNADVNGISLHVADQRPADGPPVLLIHGFPELWLPWRHQMTALAARGFRALAPDLRGYGDSTVPDDPAAYTIFHIVGDLVAPLNHLGLPKVMVVGHDWGAQVAWHLCLFRPDMVRAVVNLGVPFFPRGPNSLTDAFAGRDGLYIMQFQEPGRAERAFARYDVATVLKKFFSIEIDDLTAPPGVEIIDFLEARSTPLPWISEEELGQYAEKFQKSGFTGPINYYRMVDTNWRLTAPWQNVKIMVPTKFICGDKDIGLKSFGTEHFVKSGAFKSVLPNIEVVVIEGHHFIQQEQAKRVNSEILSYFDEFTGEMA